MKSTLQTPVQRVLGWIGSLHMAVILLVIIAVVLAWGTIYETLYSTAAAQQFIYTAWWFQSVLGVLALNLAVVALRRCPWKRRHIPFLLAHLGIILILVGAIIGGRLGIEGQLIIPEGETEKVLELLNNVLVVHEPSSDVHQVLATGFEVAAWEHQPGMSHVVELGDRTFEMTISQYYPDAVEETQILADGSEANPAIRLALSQQGQHDHVWLVAQDPDRFGVGWGNLHALFFEPPSEEALTKLLTTPQGAVHPRGELLLQFPGEERAHRIPVPAQLGEPVSIEGTPYQLTFEEYFDDFVITEHGPENRSSMPNNPAVALTLSGPEGTDAHLLFALHPDFSVMHGLEHMIDVELSFAHSAGAGLPPNAVTLIRHVSGTLDAVLTGPDGTREMLPSINVGTPYQHTWTGATFTVEEYFEQARVTQSFVNRSNEVKSPAVQVTLREDDDTQIAWIRYRQSVAIPLSAGPVVVEYRPDRYQLPFSVKLIDFRKTEYPGTQMASGFESDVVINDPERGLTLERNISMNNPLKHRGFSLFQSSYIQSQVEITVLSARNDPGTPLVYAGYIIVTLGIIGLFVFRSRHNSST